MISYRNLNSRQAFSGHLFLLLSAVFTICFSSALKAHPMPNSVVLLDIKAKGVSAELHLPLNELELAFGHHVNDNQTATLVKRLGPQLKSYLLQHIHPTSKDKQPWALSLLNMDVTAIAQSQSGPYQELVVHLWMQPKEGESTRSFIFNYNVIVHQVVTHVTLVSVRQDWDNAMLAGHPVQVGVIRMDVVNNVLPPLIINQAEGSLLTGFKSMVSLGMQHIAEGTDHLLFLLVLLLPAPLMIRQQRWAKFGGVRFSLVNILQVVTAFTIGHSITLIAGVLGWIHAPGQLIEILIAVSILISAIHALYPIFAHKEMFIAGGFGLIHGMAFASTLANLNLDTGRMILSIFGFNLGIELMQLFVILIVIPWLILLSRLPVYKMIRVAGAVFTGFASIAWIAERITSTANPVSVLLLGMSNHAIYLVPILASITFISYLLYHNNRKNRNIKTLSGWPPVL